jgi:mitochondrial import inner membrane translocase subunit TIM50
MFLSRSLGLARSATLRTPLLHPRILPPRIAIAPRVLTYQPIRRWNHQDQSGSGSKLPNSKLPNFPRPPRDDSAPSEPPAGAESAAEQAANGETDPIPKRPLPDLRKGLPSTFEQEFLKNSKAEETSTEEPDITDADPKGQSGGGKGEIPKSAYESSIDKRRNRVAQFFYISLAISGLLGAFLTGRDWEDEEAEKAHPDAPSGWGLSLWYNRIKARMNDQISYYTEPSFPKLLPDKVGQFEHLPPYTLVLGLEDLLVHEEWTRENGWRIAKRPGLDFFLFYLARHYELCVFTSIPLAMADPIFRKLDPYHLTLPLYREHTRYDNGDHVKVSSITRFNPSN